MDRPEATKLLEAFESFLKDFSAVHNMNVIVGRAKFGLSGLTVSKIQFKDPNAKPDPVDVLALKRLGLKPEFIGKVFEGSNKKHFVLLGVNLRRRKYPLILRAVGSDKQVYATVGYLKFPIY